MEYISQAWVVCPFQWPASSQASKAWGVTARPQGTGMVKSGMEAMLSLGVSYPLLCAYPLFLLPPFEDQLFSLFSMYMVQNVLPSPRLSGAQHHLWLSLRKRGSDWLQG